MKKTLIYISTLLLGLSSSALLGQNTYKADRLFNRMGYQVAIGLYGDNEDLSLDQQIRLAESFRLTGNSEKAEMHYRNIVKIDKNPLYRYYFAQALLMNNKIGEAVTNFELYNDSPDKLDSDNRATNYLNFINSDEFSNLKKVIVQNARTLNSDNFEFSPFLIDNGILFISSRSTQAESIASLNYTDFEESGSGKDIWTQKAFNKIYKASAEDDGQFSNTVLFSEVFNGTFHQGPLHINDDEDLIYFTASLTHDRNKSKKQIKKVPLEIYISILTDDDWSEPISFDIANTPEYNEAHPTLTADGQTIIFSSDRPDGFGGMDLYIAQRKDGNWTEPKNLGPVVNTSGNEVFPFLHPNGLLYFSSDGLGGFGGLDIFQINFKNNVLQDKTPINIGAPLNSNKDDFGYNSENSDQEGYFTSNRSITMGRDDIFSFVKMEETPEKEAPEEKVVVNIENIPNEPTSESLSESKKEDITITMSEKETPKPDMAPPVTVLDEVTKGVSFTLDKIYYDFDRATLRDESIPELQKLTAFLKNNPNVTIELSAHTDARGTSNYNKKLSQKRAESVVAYLNQQQVNPNRIVAKGYGEEKLRNTCFDDVDCTEAEHQYNRRTEFKILDFNEDIQLIYTDNGPSIIDEKENRPARSFSSVEIKKKRGSRKYSHIDKRTVQNIDSRLQSDGIYHISVGVYSKPEKQFNRMINLGFAKTLKTAMKDQSGTSCVSLGAIDNIKEAKAISAALSELGIKNTVVNFNK